MGGRRSIPATARAVGNQGGEAAPKVKVSPRASNTAAHFLRILIRIHAVEQPGGDRSRGLARQPLVPEPARWRCVLGVTGVTSPCQGKAPTLIERRYPRRKLVAALYERRCLGRRLTSVSGSPVSLLSESRCGAFLNASSRKAAQKSTGMVAGTGDRRKSSTLPILLPDSRCRRMCCVMAGVSLARRPVAAAFGAFGAGALWMARSCRCGFSGGWVWDRDGPRSIGGARREKCQKSRSDPKHAVDLP